MNDLQRKFEFLTKQLSMVIQEKDSLCHPSVVKASQELDSLIVEIQKNKSAKRYRDKLMFTWVI